MKVNEIFESIQGEGEYAGYPALFIRLAGCNRKCKFCDTKHNEGENINISKLKKIISYSKQDNVIFTGGEPLLQLDELVDLIKICNNKNFMLETNGDKITENNIELLFNLFSYVCVSPKDKKTAKRCKKLLETKTFPFFYDIKVVTDLKLNKNLIPYATCLMPLTTNKSSDTLTNQLVWKYCVENRIRYSPRLHVDVWKGLKGV